MSSFFQCFQPKFVLISDLPHAWYVPHQSDNIWWRQQIMKLFVTHKQFNGSAWSMFACDVTRKTLRPIVLGDRTEFSFHFSCYNWVFVNKFPCWFKPHLLRKLKPRFCDIQKHLTAFEPRSSKSFQLTHGLKQQTIWPWSHSVTMFFLPQSHQRASPDHEVIWVYALAKATTNYTSWQRSSRPVKRAADFNPARLPVSSLHATLILKSFYRTLQVKIFQHKRVYIACRVIRI